MHTTSISHHRRSLMLAGAAAAFAPPLSLAQAANEIIIGGSIPMAWASTPAFPIT